MSIRDGILVIKNNGFLSLKIEGDSKIVMNCYNKRISVSYSIKILIQDIWKLSRNLINYSCHNPYKEANRIANCLTKKCIGIIDSRT